MAGIRLEILVRQRGFVGKYTRFRIRDGVRPPLGVGLGVFQTVELVSVVLHLLLADVGEVRAAQINGVDVLVPQVRDRGAMPGSVAELAEDPALALPLEGREVEATALVVRAGGGWHAGVIAALHDGDRVALGGQPGPAEQRRRPSAWRA